MRNTGTETAGMVYGRLSPRLLQKKSRKSLPWKESATSPVPLVGEDLGGGKERNFLAACCSAAEVEMLGGGWTTAAGAGVEVTAMAAGGAFLTTVRGVRILRIRSHVKLQNMAIIGSGRIRIQCLRIRDMLEQTRIWGSVVPYLTMTNGSGPWIRIRLRIRNTVCIRILKPVQAFFFSPIHSYFSKKEKNL
jgi:hypothetical protein